MSDFPVVIAVGVVDALGIRGSSGVRGDWRALGVPPLGTGRTFRTLFGRSDPALRRLDRATRTLVLAAEAAGLADALPREVREGTALVVETALGCLDADLRFAANWPEASGAATLFPGTLPSAGLGELALRFGLRGPTTCLSIEAGGAGAAWHEAVRLLEDGDVSYVVTGAFELLENGAVPQVPPAVSAVVAVLAAAAPAASVPLTVPWAALQDARDPFTLLASPRAGWCA